MRTTIEIDDELFAKAREYAGLHDESAVVQIALKAFLEREAGRRLRLMGGTQPDAEAPPRRRFANGCSQRVNAGCAKVVGIMLCAAIDIPAKSEPMDSSDEKAKKLLWLKTAIEEGMADVEAGRVVQWDFEDFLKRAHERISSQMNALDGEIRDGRHHMQVRVYYEDTDFSGIVYHANYLRFMERGRTNHLRLMGASQHELFAQAQAETPGFAFVVRSMQLDFLRPARMDDVLDIVTWPVAVKGASITLAQEVRRGDEVLVKAEVRVAFICEGRAQPIPKSLRLLMKADLES